MGDWERAKQKSIRGVARLCSFQKACGYRVVLWCPVLSILFLCAGCSTVSVDATYPDQSEPGKRVYPTSQAAPHFTRLFKHPLEVHIGKDHSKTQKENEKVKEIQNSKKSKKTHSKP